MSAPGELFSRQALDFRAERNEARQSVYDLSALLVARDAELAAARDSLVIAIQNTRDASSRATDNATAADAYRQERDAARDVRDHAWDVAATREHERDAARTELQSTYKMAERLADERDAARAECAILKIRAEEGYAAANRVMTLENILRAIVAEVDAAVFCGALQAANVEATPAMIAAREVLK